MNPLDLIPGQWKLIGAAIGGLALLALLGTAAAVIDKHGYDKAAAVYQPKLDLAHQQLGEAVTANEANQATIADLLANDKANSALLDAYEAKIAALDQQSDDVAATIRKLQHDDQSIDAFLRTPVPAALRSVLAGRPPGSGAAASGGANQDGLGAAAKAGPLPTTGLH